MLFQSYAPPASLKQFVRCFWVLESDDSYLHHSMASGCPELIFHYRNRFDEINGNALEPSFQSGLHAAGTCSRQFITTTGFGIFGAFLYPYVIPLMLKESSHAFTNQMVDLVSFLGNTGRILEEEMMLAPGNAERYQLLVSFLEKKLLPNLQANPPVFQVIRQIIESGGDKKIQDLHGEAYLSQRQFERKFLYYTGMPPKTFTRLNRFQKALDLYGKKQSLTQVAYHCGYFDQSHFIHEFKEFSGLHPGVFFSGSRQNENWRDA